MIWENFDFMKLLRTEFKAKGFYHKLIKRDGDWAVFERTAGSSVHYELIEVQKIKECEMFGNKVEAHEAFPSSELWGRKGFTIMNKEEALNRLKNIKELIKIKEEQNDA